MSDKSGGLRTEISPGAKFKVLSDVRGFGEGAINKSAADCVGIAGYSGKVVSVAQMDVAIFAIEDVKE